MDGDHVRHAPVGQGRVLSERGWGQHMVLRASESGRSSSRDVQAVEEMEKSRLPRGNGPSTAREAPRTETLGKVVRRSILLGVLALSVIGIGEWWSGAKWQGWVKILIVTAFFTMWDLPIYMWNGVKEEKLRRRELEDGPDR